MPIIKSCRMRLFNFMEDLIWKCVVRLLGVGEWMHEIDCLSREVHLSWMRSYSRSVGRYSHSLFDSCAGFGLIHLVDITKHRRFHEIDTFCSTLVSKTRLSFQPDKRKSSIWHQ